MQHCSRVLTLALATLLYLITC